MLIPIYQKKFEKDVQRSKKRGLKLQKLKDIIKLLASEDPLPVKNRNHKLKGNYANLWECHIEPDWLLIYQITTTQLILIRTGTHSDLFK